MNFRQPCTYLRIEDERDVVSDSLDITGLTTIHPAFSGNCFNMPSALVGVGLVLLQLYEHQLSVTPHGDEAYI